jgi:hypothetical protein
MSQRQKQVTNDKRAKRLGTGEGIARDRRSSGGSGGIPGWAWIAVLVVAVAAIGIGVGIALAGGGDSSSGSKGQDSQVVQERLSTEKIDFTSQGTWKPEYSNLSAAMTALGLPAASDFTEHYHAHLHLIFEGHDVPVPINVGIDQASQTLSPIHTHDERGVIHVEADQKDFRATLLQVFDIWGVKLTSDCVGGYCNGVKAWNNGKPINPLTYQLEPHDAITIVEGTPPAGFKPDATFKFASGE